MVDEPAPGRITKVRHGINIRQLRWARVALHTGLGLLSLWIALTFLDTRQELICAGTIVTTLMLIEGSRFRIPDFNAWVLKLLGVLAHQHEDRHLTSATWFWVAIFSIALLGSELILALTLGVLSLGDQVAGIIGRRFGTITLLNGRSLEGSAAFVVSSSLLCFGILHMYFPALAPSQVFWLTIVPPLCGALSELLCSRVDDNLGVGLGTGLGTWATCLFLGLN